MRFMVMIEMTGDFDDDFMALVREDTAYSDRLRSSGIQEGIYMRSDYRLCWTVFHASSRAGLQAVLEGFPLYSRLRYEVHELAEEHEEMEQKSSP